jgi:NADP-dependent 3-hydroxy acid dehydrogenase YdfG
VVVADYGMELDGTGWSQDPVESVVQEIRDAGGDAIAVFANCAVETEAQRVVETAVNAYGKVDVLVNNAGISDPDWFAEQSSERIRRMTDNQYYSTVWMTRAAWPFLVTSGGNVVNTASEALLDGHRIGVRLNAICPRGNTRLSAPEVLARHYDQPAESFKSEWFEGMRPEYPTAAVIAFAHESCDLTGETFVCGDSTSATWVPPPSLPGSVPTSRRATTSTANQRDVQAALKSQR